jgi:hypothetical protein
VSEPSPAAVVVEVGIREMIENLYESGMRKSRQSSAPAPPGGGGEETLPLAVVVAALVRITSVC